MLISTNQNVVQVGEGTFVSSSAHDVVVLRCVGPLRHFAGGEVHLHRGGGRGQHHARGLVGGQLGLARGPPGLGEHPRRATALFRQEEGDFEEFSIAWSKVKKNNW